MMNNRQRLLLWILCSFALSYSCFAQLRYPVVGTYKGKSAQGMAIWSDEAFLFNDGGHCRVLDLKKGIVVREFNLASSGKNTHVNAACFGNVFPNDSKPPLIYISEYNTPSRCFVECLEDSTSILVQTIQIQNNGMPVFVQSWIPDTSNMGLYAIARTAPSKGQKNSSKVKISKYRLPSVEEGSHIILTEVDCLDSFFVEFASGTQGGVIKGNYMYLPTGLQESARGRFNAERALQVINLKKRQIVRKVDLSFVTTNEPEDIDFYKGNAFLYCGQEGGIYEIKLK